MSRGFNFSAGPAVLPEPVLRELREVLLEFGDARAGLMEISHRSAAFEAVIASAEARLRRVLGVPAEHKVGFFQGGATQQFAMHALNLARPGEAADYVITGTWAEGAHKEAKKALDAGVCWTSAPAGHTHTPQPGEALGVRASAKFLHYTTNTTVYGTQCPAVPEVDLPLVADMSSDIGSRPLDVGRHALIYAGAQKNLGPSGVTIAILSPWAMEQSAACAKARGGLPVVMDYKAQIDKGSMYNTPNTWGIFVLERVLAWMEAEGGLATFSAKNRARAARLYAALDASAFWRPHARPDSRSDMNVTFRIHDPSLEGAFVAEAEAAGLLALAGHRSVGGMRASLYNALPDAAVDALIAFMAEFEARRG
jgi:phosphoserine aminotransferase